MSIKRLLHFFIFLLLIEYSSFGQKNLVEPNLDWIDKGMDNNPKQTFDSIQFLIRKKTIQPYHKVLLLDKLIYINFFELKDYKASFELVRKIEQEYHKSKDIRMKIIHLENLGMLYYESKSNEKLAFELFDDAYQLSQKEGSNFHAEYILNNHGVSLLNNNAFKEASTKFHAAIHFAKKAKDKNQECIILSNLGILHLIDQQLDSAEIYLLKSFNCALNTRKLNDEVERATYLGAFYLDTKNMTKAGQYLHFAEKKYVYVNSNESKRFLFELLSRYNEELKNDKKALYFAKMSSNYRDSIDYSNINKQLLSKENSIRITKLENQNALQQLKLKQEKYRNLLFLIISILVVGIITSIAILLLNRNKHRIKIAELEAKKHQEDKIKLSEELEESDRDITIKSMVLLEKENLMNRITKILKETLPQLSNKDQQIVQAVIQELSFSMNNKGWDEFEIRFNKVHPNFYKKLNDSHKSLTLNEKKLSAFLLMNMTTKDISAITGQSTHSINVARTRLRKKLGLANSNLSFTEYLIQFS